MTGQVHTRPMAEQVAAAVERARTPYSHFHRLKEEIVTDNEVLFEALTLAQADLAKAVEDATALTAIGMELRHDLTEARAAIRNAHLLIGMFRSFALSGEDVLPSDDEKLREWGQLPAVKAAME